MTATPPGDPVRLAPDRPRWRETLGLLVRNKVALGAALVLLAIIVVAVFDDTFAPQPANAQDIANRLQAPSWSHPFGTDDLGRDILIRVIIGASV